MSEHSSRRSTERSNYEDLRRSGISKDHARRIAEEASVKTHRIQDQIHSDKRR